MGRTCCVPECKSSGFKTPQLRFFGFPKNEDLKKLWLIAIEKGLGRKLAKNEIHPSGRICEFHFKNEDFERIVRDDGTLEGAVYLKRIVSSIPSVFGEHQIRLEKTMGKIKRCRICLKAKTSIKLDTCLPGTDITVTQAALKTFNYSFNLHPNFPQSICDDCFKFIISAHTFKLLMLNTDVALLEQEKFLLKHKSINKVQDQSKKETPVTFVKVPETTATSSKETPVTFVKVPETTATSSKATNENVFFIIKEISQNEIKTKPEMAIEGDQLAFAQYLSDEDDVMAVEVENEVIDLDDSSSNDSIYNGVEPIYRPLDVEKMLKTVLDKEESERKEKEMREKFPSNICKKCQFKAKNASELADHLESSMKDCLSSYDGIVKCILCQKKFIDERKKNHHIANDHKITEIPECKYCDRKDFRDIMAYERHISCHIEAPKFICATCGKGFHEKGRLDDHMKAHDKNYSFDCDLCPFQTKVKAAMQSHQMRHANIKPFMCEKCSGKFLNNGELKRHNFAVHKFTAEGCYCCELCEYCYLTKNQYQMHVSRPCKGINSKRYPRTSCRIQLKDLDPRCFVKPPPSPLPEWT